MKWMLRAGGLTLAVALVGGTETPAVEKADIDRAVESGVAALKRLQQPDGTWPYAEIGATALAGLALLESGVKADDPAVAKAAAAVRRACPTMIQTYSLSLSILFLDRLDNLADTPLIESMTARLLAGEYGGVWTYNCPSVPAAEQRRLLDAIGGRVLVGRRDLSKLPPKGKRSERDLPREVKDLMSAIVRRSDGGAGDHSNTQFATIALWVGRRYGLPVQPALLRVEEHYRTVQNADGGWAYTGRLVRPRVEVFEASTATMTCAGLLGLAAGHGAVADLNRTRDPKRVIKRDITKDAALKNGLQAVATAVGKPVGALPGGGRAGRPMTAGGKAYYFLWSLERVAVAFGLETIGKKDWYGWAAEVLLANQQRDGSWRGDYAASGADTAFALLVLRRSNLTPDLTSVLRSAGLRDPGERKLRAGGVGGAALTGKRPPGLEGAGIGDASARTAGRRPPARTPKRSAASGGTAGRLAREVVEASGERQGDLLEQLRDGKGSAYTEALAGVIGRLEGSARRKARDALADRLGRMKATTLRAYMKDDNPEVRRAAALACTAKRSLDCVPELITLLNDTEPLVERAAHAALKHLTGKDFGPSADATRVEHARAVAAWRAWWKKRVRE
jgi:hypothetical protein